MTTPPVTTDRLRRCGEALYGDRWQTDIARDLGLGDARRIRQWMAGERPIPAGVWDDLAALLIKRKTLIDAILSDGSPTRRLQDKEEK